MNDSENKTDTPSTETKEVTISQEDRLQLMLFGERRARLTAERDKLDAQLENVALQTKQFTAEMSSKYKIDLDGMTIDVATGRIAPSLRQV
jgi:hypothetical protein